jgi:putative membrane protein
MRLLLRLLINAAALWAAVQLVDGVTHTGSTVSLLGVALVFGLVNAIIKPLLMLFTLPALILTLGLFTFVINALMLMLTSALSGAFGLGFHVDGFWSALLGSLVISIASAVLSMFLPDRKRERERYRED